MFFQLFPLQEVTLSKLYISSFYPHSYLCLTHQSLHRTSLLWRSRWDAWNVFDPHVSKELLVITCLEHTVIEFQSLYCSGCKVWKVNLCNGDALYFLCTWSLWLSYNKKIKSALSWLSWPVLMESSFWIILCIFALFLVKLILTNHE